MLGYPTLDYLPDLTPEAMKGAGNMVFEPYQSTSQWTTWDNYATFYTSQQYAILRSTFSWEGKAGATYDFASSSFFDPFLIQVYDRHGNVVATGGAGNDGTYGTDYLWNFVAPYSGTYYVDAGWDQGLAAAHRFVSLSIYEDTDTIPIAPQPPTPIQPTPPTTPEPPATPERPTGEFSQGIDVDLYLRQNPDVSAAGVDAITHYMQWGWQEGRDPNSLFDTDWYLTINRDVAEAGLNPLEHYMLYGWQEGRDPSAKFDTTHYLDTHADVALAGMNPLEHYLNWGISEGREIAAVV